MGKKLISLMLCLLMLVSLLPMNYAAVALDETVITEEITATETETAGEENDTPAELPDVETPEEPETDPAEESTPDEPGTQNPQEEEPSEEEPEAPTEQSEEASGNGATGVIHFKVRLWDYTQYRKTGKAADAQTDIPVCGLDMSIKTYRNSDAATGHPAAYLDGREKDEPHDYDSLGMDLSGRMTTDENGEFTLTLTADELRKLTADWLLDVAPENTDTASFDRGYGTEITTFDTEIYDRKDPMGVGEYPLRKVTDTVNIDVGARKENQYPKLTAGSLTDGFELTWTCYVVAETTVTFDSDGGTEYPVQTFAPKKHHLPKDWVFKAKYPGAPERNADEEFVAWYEVDPLTGETFVTPFDFTKEITHCTVLKAIYRSKCYHVIWKNYDGTVLKTDTDYAAGVRPVYTGETPVKAAQGNVTFVFDGWQRDGKGTVYKASELPVVGAATADRAVYYAGSYTYVAHYKEIAKYTVKHNLEQLDGTYLTVETETDLQGEVGKNTEAKAKDYPGFTVQSFSQKKIDGGDTVVEICYDRCTYSVTGVFTPDARGKSHGTVTKNNQPAIKYQAKSSAMVFTPEKGYRITGVTVNGVPVIDFTDGGYTFAEQTITENKTVTVTAAPITYQIHYVLNGGINDNENPTSYTVESPTLTLKNPRKENYTFIGWQEGSRLESGSTGDKTFTALWEENTVTVNYYTIGFGSVSTESETVGVVTGTLQGSVAVADNNYKFAGWFTNPECTVSACDGEKLIPEQKITAAYYAKFVLDTASYTVEHYLQNTDGKTYTLDSVSPQIGTIGNKTQAAAKEVTGFTARPIEKKTIAADDSDTVKIYYDRNLCKYTVTCMEKDTDNILKTVRDTAPYGTEVPVNAEKIPGFTFESTEKSSIVIGMTENTATLLYTRNSHDAAAALAGTDEGFTTAQGTGTYAYDAKVTFTAECKPGYEFVGWFDNEEGSGEPLSTELTGFTFPMPDKDITYWAKSKEQTVDYIYRTVCVDNVADGLPCGTVTTPASGTETVGKVNGQPTATVEAGAYYDFIGWFDNAEGTGTPLSEELTYVPNERDTDNLLTGGTFYAVFKRQTGKLLLTGTGTKAGASEQVILTVTGEGIDGELRIALKGEGGTKTIAGLYLGATYTVTEDSGWSWKYSSDQSSQITLTSDGVKLDVSGTEKTEIPWLAAENGKWHIFG